ncbi:MAG: BON domain-containing protein [Bythopirellula sp.]|nr:BON domain-containing protein [Bythopirellula sp.]
MSETNSNQRSADADLLTRVGIALTLRLRHTLHAVHIHVDKGTVTLRGMVPTFYDRQLAIEVTRRVAGVRRVLDELTVASQHGSQIDETKARRAENPRSLEATNAVRGAGTESARRSLASASSQRPQPAQSWRNLFANAATVLRGLFLSLAVLLAVGCGEAALEKLPVYPAKGSITFKGKPIPGAMITLHPTTPVENVPNPQANVSKDGTFSIRTYGAEEGAPEGDYKLTVLWYKPIVNGPDFTSGPNVIPQKFTKPETTSIEIKIAAGKNDLPTIQL